MLILNNGAPKSGTTWIQSILRSVPEVSFPDPKWQNGNKNPSIARDRISEYFQSDEWRKNNVLVKMHEKYDDDLSFIADPEIRVVITYRNLPDSVVSWYHHQLRLGKTTADQKNDWLESEGRRYCVRIISQRLSWIDKPNTLLMRYEDMIADPATKIFDLLAFCGLPVSHKIASEMAQKTRKGPFSADKLRDGKHVRTGGVSVASTELPAEFLKSLLDLEDLVSSGLFDEKVASRFLKEGKKN